MKFTIFDADFFTLWNFTPGRYNAAYFEHAYLAEQTAVFFARRKIFLWKAKK